MNVSNNALDNPLFSNKNLCRGSVFTIVFTNFNNNTLAVSHSFISLVVLLSSLGLISDDKNILWAVVRLMGKQDDMNFQVSMHAQVDRLSTYVRIAASLHISKNICRLSAKNFVDHWCNIFWAVHGQLFDRRDGLPHISANGHSLPVVSYIA